MRYFIIGFAFVVVVVVSVAGFRGDTSRKPPIEVFPDMDRQPKLRPQEPNDFFASGKSSQLPVEGTIARATPLANTTYPGLGGDVFKFDEVPVTTGQMINSTNFIPTNPFPVTAEFLARGQERYAISCVPCHGALGDGRGITSQFGVAAIANFHTQPMIEMTDGQMFHTITSGKGLMAGYGANIAIEDRWAIVAYVRALQLTQLATVEDVPEDERANLNPQTESYE